MADSKSPFKAIASIFRGGKSPGKKQIAEIARLTIDQQRQSKESTEKTHRTKIIEQRKRENEFLMHFGPTTTPKRTSAQSSIVANSFNRAYQILRHDERLEQFDIPRMIALIQAAATDQSWIDSDVFPNNIWSFKASFGFDKQNGRNGMIHLGKDTLMDLATKARSDVSEIQFPILRLIDGQIQSRETLCEFYLRPVFELPMPQTVKRPDQFFDLFDHNIIDVAQCLAILGAPVGMHNTWKFRKLLDYVLRAYPNSGSAPNTEAKRWEKLRNAIRNRDTVLYGELGIMFGDLMLLEDPLNRELINSRLQIMAIQHIFAAAATEPCNGEHVYRVVKSGDDQTIEFVGTVRRVTGKKTSTTITSNDTTYQYEIWLDSSKAKRKIYKIVQNIRLQQVEVSHDCNAFPEHLRNPIRTRSTFVVWCLT